MNNFLTIFKMAGWSFFKYIPLSTLGYIAVLLAWINSPFIAAYSVLLNKNEVGGFWGQLYTHNDSLDGGQNQNEWPKDVTKWGLWWQRTCWICRNPAYRFCAEYLGVPGDAKVIHQIVADGEFHDDWVVIEDAKGKRYFGWRKDIYISESKFIKIWIGWSYPKRGGIYMLQIQPPTLKTKD